MPWTKIHRGMACGRLLVREIGLNAFAGYYDGLHMVDAVTMLEAQALLAARTYSRDPRNLIWISNRLQGVENHVRCFLSNGQYLGTINRVIVLRTRDLERCKRLLAYEYFWRLDNVD